MSKVLTFSRYYPSYHPKKGQPTYFVDKIWKGLYEINNGDVRSNMKNVHQFDSKYHTIRAGHRFKTGDWFSPRVWSGRPYKSKQIIIAPDIQVKKTWDFDIEGSDIFLDGRYDFTAQGWSLDEVSKNDGLNRSDFLDWFKFTKQNFHGQIICWNENINY
jgi:hypothetical protein